MWLYVPCLSAPASEDSTSQSISHWEQCARSVTLNGNSPRPGSLRSAWRKGAFRPLQFGAISQPSMDAACEAWWTSLRRASRARITLSPENAKDGSEGTARCGISYAKPFAVSSRGSSFWRTYPASAPLISEMEEADSDGSFQPGCGLFLATWPRSGTMRNGCAFERPTWAPLITEIDGSASHGAGIWTTPDAGAQTGGSTHRTIAKDAMAWPQAPLRRKNHGENWRQQPLVPAWPTPMATEGKTPGARTRTKHSLSSASAAWTTPTLDDVNNITRRSRQQRSLTRDANLWQTPSTQRFRTRGGNRSDELGLDNQAKAFPTPSARDAKGENHSRHLAAAKGRKHMDQLPNFIAHSDCSPQRRIDSTSGSACSTSSNTLRRRLNPAFVSWLMGFPWWWTQPVPLSFAHSEMQSYLCRLRSLCARFCGDPESSFGDENHE